MADFGGNFKRFFNVLKSRRETFKEERAKRPETWTFDWRDRPRDSIRELLGTVIGEPPAVAQPP